MKAPQKNFHNAAITLVELVLVMVILVILASLGIPQLQKAKASQDLKGAVRSIAAALLYAKTASFKYPSGVTIEIGEGEVTICKGNSGNCNDADILKSYDLPPEIKITEDTITGIYFKQGISWRGNAFGVGHISITHEKIDKCLQVTLSKAGRIKVGNCE